MKDLLDFLLALLCAVLLARWIYLSVQLWMAYRRELPAHSPIRVSKFYQKPRSMRWLNTNEFTHPNHHRSMPVGNRPPFIRAQLAGMKTISPTAIPDPQTGRRPRPQDKEIAGHSHRAHEH
jgi:hypothetical protein